MVRATTAHDGPTRPARQNRGESAAVRTTRPMVATLAMPVARPMYRATKYGTREKKITCSGMLSSSVLRAGASIEGGRPIACANSACAIAGVQSSAWTAAMQNPMAIVRR